MINQKTLISMVNEIQDRISECTEEAFRKDGGVDNYFYGKANAYTDVVDMIYDLIRREAGK